jgi:hypothetical protein
MTINLTFVFNEFVNNLKYMLQHIMFILIFGENYFPTYMVTNLFGHKIKHQRKMFS